ncbi:MAG TPA: efflux transporter periplasmic adaptor subunit, partial [Rariglobus sp.]
MSLKHVLLPATFASVLVLSGCSKKTAATTPTPAEVGVITVAPSALTLTRDLPGRTSAFLVAEVRARVSGIVLQRHFTEGG